MKKVSLIAIGLAIALSVGAQTTSTPEEKQETNQQETGKAKPAENAKANQGREVKQSVQPKQGERTRVNGQETVNPSDRKGARVNSEEGVRSNGGEHARVHETGKVSQSTTVFRNGHESREHLALHRGLRERNDVHFRIGTHSRDWWLRTYSITLMDGCYYYLADDGCWYPAYGFAPGCDYPPGVVYCE